MNSITFSRLGIGSYYDQVDEEDLPAAENIADTAIVTTDVTVTDGPAPDPGVADAGPPVQQTVAISAAPAPPGFWDSESDAATVATDKVMDMRSSYAPDSAAAQRTVSASAASIVQRTEDADAALTAQPTKAADPTTTVQRSGTTDPANTAITSTTPENQTGAIDPAATSITSEKQTETIDSVPTPITRNKPIVKIAPPIKPGRVTSTAESFWVIPPDLVNALNATPAPQQLPPPLKLPLPMITPPPSPPPQTAQPTKPSPPSTEDLESQASSLKSFKGLFNTFFFDPAYREKRWGMLFVAFVLVALTITIAVLEPRWQKWGRIFPTEEQLNPPQVTTGLNPVWIVPSSSPQ
ncbi:hypothetical protein P152DRAFT_471387 [Eremomyces bilateralis CBS 781.70]|uniref:Uncharacterized protein n=1 Tax=Eremomyces bilateralis CBS 781.70 TaxID=1392243 RepID=A0A6G1GA35_9PEZI|nr:uncharacterized protein P152DRAFT_471387 [Eremomyces bilateralis CBS 781.70]KAF1814709.1 hypothetical protein P152DRAFT_471387 [Eremomyces bilateralis CBS 781.70]